MSIIAEIFEYSFLSRAFFVGLLVSLSASLIGVSLVLRRFSMIGDGLSHVGFGALGLAALLSIAPMALTLPVVVLSAIFLLNLSQKSKGGDGYIALISSGSLALGVIAVSLGGVNTDLNAFLFGSILAVSKSDAVIASVLSILTLASYVLFYHQIYITTFDPAFSKATGIKPERYTFLLSILTAMIVVIGMRMLGSLLVSSLIIFPAMTAMRLGKSYKAVTILSGVESVIAFVIGFMISYVYSLPTGASIVSVHMVMYLLALSFSSVRNLAMRRLL